MGDIKDLMDTFDLSSDAGIIEAIAALSQKEVHVNDHLNTILSKQSLIETKMAGITKTLNNLNMVRVDSNKLSDMINHTSVLAKNVSAKVRRLDEARSRVSECQQRVHDLIDLQLCSQGVIAAIKEEEYEKGASHIQRFLSMDQNLLQRTADDVSGSIASVHLAVNTLEDATKQMRDIVTQKFDDAIKRDDLASVERFFKIYPQLNMHKEGIEKFSHYICNKLNVKHQRDLRTCMDVAKAEKRSNVAYADALTMIFENLARVVEVNQPLLDSYYGNGRLLDLVTVLQRECDQEMRNLLQEFNLNRHINRRISKINEYIKNSGQQARGLGHYRNVSGGGSIDKLNPKDIDMLIGEITIMHSRAELYIKFMRRRVKNDLDASHLEDELKQEKLQQFENLITKSALSRQMQETLSNYLLFERYFMEESVLKAIAMDTLEPGQYFSSMVDEVFFIIRKSIRRAITTQSLDGICAVINNAASCFENDFANAMKTPLRNGYPSGYIDLAQAYNALQSSIQLGKIQTNDTEHAKSNFIAQLNNADMATEFIETLWNTISEEVQMVFPGMSGHEKEILDSCLSGMKSVRDTMKATVDYGMQQLRSSALKPRINPWLDQFINYNHQFTEDELSTYEAGETFIQFLITKLDELLNTFKTTLSPRNFDALVSILAADVATRLEKCIIKCSFNRLGGLVLDQEVRALSSYITGATSWTVRDKLARLTQIATLLNLEKVTELNDYYNPLGEHDAPAWRITPNEMRQLLVLRSDFRLDEIKRLKL